MNQQLPEYNISFFKGLFNRSTNPSQSYLRKALRNLTFSIFEKNKDNDISVDRVVVYYEDGGILHLHRNTEKFEECIKKPNLQDLEDLV